MKKAGKDMDEILELLAAALDMAEKEGKPVNELFEAVQNEIEVEVHTARNQITFVWNLPAAI